MQKKKKQSLCLAILEQMGIQGQTCDCCCLEKEGKKEAGEVFGISGSVLERGTGPGASSH